ncbi:hypothetical protein BGW38_005515, partial [Lunasporangiospora selenospora]
MEAQESGLVTPPIVSPRPIQTPKSPVGATSALPLAASTTPAAVATAVAPSSATSATSPSAEDSSWKVVGSPPRRPLLSPPDEKEKDKAKGPLVDALVKDPAAIIGAYTRTMSTDSIISSNNNNNSNNNIVNNTINRYTTTSSTTTTAAAMASVASYNNNNNNGSNNNIYFNTVSNSITSTTTSAPSSTTDPFQNRQRASFSTMSSTALDASAPGANYFHSSTGTVSRESTLDLGQRSVHPASTATLSSSQALDYAAPSSSRLNSFLQDNSTAVFPPFRAPSQNLAFGPLDSGTNAPIGSSDYSKTAATPPGLTHPGHPSNLSGKLHDDPAGLIQGSTALESPLGLSSFLWSARAGEETKGLSTNSTTIHTTLAAGMSATGAGGRGNHNSNSNNNNMFSMSTALHVDPFVPSANSRTVRSLSLSEPIGYSFGLSSTTGHTSNSATNTNSNATGPGMFGHEGSDVLGALRTTLPTMEEESEDGGEPRASRTRSYSTSATFGSGGFYPGLSNSAFSAHPTSATHDSFTSPNPNNSLGYAVGQQDPFASRKYSGGSTWPSAAGHGGLVLGQDRPLMSSTHRRSLTSASFVAPIWESSATYLPAAASVEKERVVVDRQRIPRRFSLAPSSGFQTYDHFLENEHTGVGAGNASHSTSGYNSGRQTVEHDFVHPQRRHSVAGPSGSYLRPSAATAFNLASSLESLHLEENDAAGLWANDDLFDQSRYPTQDPGPNSLAKGLSLSQLANHGLLYVVEFKSGRSDLFYVTEDSGLILKRGDLVMVEADRGQDLGKIVNDSITPEDVQLLREQHAAAAAVAAAAAAAAAASQHDGMQGGQPAIH